MIGRRLLQVLEGLFVLFQEYFQVPASAAELPQATLGHHWQGSRHIANEVVTAGISHGIFRLEASGFHGQEPNENRWNIDYGAIDSWSSRLSVSPSKNWMAGSTMRCSGIRYTRIRYTRPFEPR